MSDLRTSSRLFAAILAALETALGPWLDLAIRLWLAQAFLVVQVHEMMAGAVSGNGLAAPLGSAWWLGALHGIMASSLGVAVQTACPLLLALGLLRRPAALAMLVQAFLPPAAGPDAHLFWMALLLRVVLIGPGPLSLDHLLRRGVESIALPGAALAGHAFAALQRWGSPATLFGLRVWLALAPAGIALGALGVAAGMRPGAGLPQVPQMVTGLAPRVALGQISGAVDARLPWALLLAILVLLLGAGCLVPALAAAQASNRPVIVELFTSQGCLSCPPADAIVADLARHRPDLLPLTFHVTYWNNLGWQDPFSFAGATERQRRYVAASVSPNVYTPAMVVDGRRDVVGSDRAAVEATLARAKAELTTAASVTIARAGTVLTITVGAGSGGGKVLLLGYDRQHQTPVGRGENGGRTLLEANIVRSMSVAGTWTGQALRLDAAIPAGEEVAVVVQADDGRVLGAGRLASNAS